MHADRWRREGVARREDQSAPVLAIMVWSIWRSCEDIMPSNEGLERGSCAIVCVTYSRMLDSEGCATINGGGFADMVWYSLVSW